MRLALLFFPLSRGLLPRRGARITPLPTMLLGAMATEFMETLHLYIQSSPRHLLDPIQAEQANISTWEHILDSDFCLHFSPRVPQAKQVLLRNLFPRGILGRRSRAARRLGGVALCARTRLREPSRHLWTLAARCYGR